jgi:hypothetical protein
MDRAGVVALIGAGVSAGLAQHVGAGLDLTAGACRGAFDHPGELQRSERLPRDRLPPLLGDLHPDHCPFPTADVNAPPLHDGISLNHQPSQLIDREAVGQ